MSGTRVTDAVEFFRQREEHREAVRLVRNRAPEARRWRAAVARMSGTLGRLGGRERSMIDASLREVVLDLGDRALRVEVVLDARRAHVDWDRGEVLAPKTVGDVRRTAFLANIDLSMLKSHVTISDDFFAPVDVAGLAVVGRAYSDAFRRRAHRLALELPIIDESARLTVRERGIAAQVGRDDCDATRWSAFAKSMLAGSV